MHRNDVECENFFIRMGKVFNANTPENHPSIFLSDEDYKAAMSILAISVRMYHDIRIFAFQLMSNHIHLVIGGDCVVIQEFFAFFVRRLDKHFNLSLNLSGFRLKLFPVESLSYFRNAVVYVNRNGFVVSDDVTPFSYPWGSSQYFFQPMLRQFAEKYGNPIGLMALRELVHSKKCDSLKSLRMIDGFVSPLEFCDVDAAEMAFRDAKQYFYCISRNVETYLDVAKSLGESVFYNDTDLYLVAVKLAKARHDSSDLRTAGKRPYFRPNARFSVKRPESRAFSGRMIQRHPQGVVGLCPSNEWWCKAPKKTARKSCWQGGLEGYAPPMDGSARH